jgi:hypothetical protein
MHSALSVHLEAAVTALVGNGTLKDRLCTAWCEHLDGLSVHEMPEEAQDEFEALTRVMHGARALPGDSVVRASIRKFSNDEAERCAALILRLYRLRIEELTATPRVPARAASAPRESTPLAALLALEGGARSGARAKQASRG